MGRGHDRSRTRSRSQVPAARSKADGGRARHLGCGDASIPRRSRRRRRPRPRRFAGVTLAAPAVRGAARRRRRPQDGCMPTRAALIDVLANDSDPDGDELADLPRRGRADDADYYVDIDGDKLFVATRRGHAARTSSSTTTSATSRRLVPATLTISFREIHPIKVAKLDRPGRLRVTNDNKTGRPLPLRELPRGPARRPRPRVRARLRRHPGASPQDRLDRLLRVAACSSARHVRGIELPARDSQSDARDGHPHSRRGQALGQTALTGQPVTPCLRP